MFKFHPFPDSARCFLAISMTLVQYLLVRFWPGRKLFPVTISHTERVPSNVAFLNLPFLSHHGCQEGFWEASTHSKAGTCSSESPPKPSSMHETASPTVCFLFSFSLCGIPVGCCLINTDSPPNLLTWSINTVSCRTALIHLEIHHSWGAYDVTVYVPFPQGINVYYLESI